MKRTRTAIAILATLTVAACSAPAPELNLTPADAAACRMLDGIIPDFEAGYNATEAFERNVTTWGDQMPSDNVRGAVNAFRRWVATERDEAAGFASYDDSVDALAAALRERKVACGG
jgi:hypothetical protein